MNTYTLEKNGRTHILIPIKDKEVKPEVNNRVLLMSGKELLTEVKKKEDPQFFVVRKPRIVLTKVPPMCVEEGHCDDHSWFEIVDDYSVSNEPLEDVSRNLGLWIMLGSCCFGVPRDTR
jgi:hypothetical protein